jgi:threonine dehydratase
LVSYEDILDARDHLHPEIVRTPLLPWRHAASRAGAEVRLKLETLQRTGSFKARGGVESHAIPAAR